MIFRVIVSLITLTVSFATTTIKNMGDYYHETDGYKPGAWNYDYTQTADKCPKSCSTTMKCGPACWHTIVATDTTVNECGGHFQTPINLNHVHVDPKLNYSKALSFDVFDDGCDTWAQFADDHAYEVSFVDKSCTNLKVQSNLKGYLDGDVTPAVLTYTLKQFHFHTPAEHIVGGGLADGELHMVHKTDDGKNALVIGVRIVATPNPTARFDANLDNRPVQPIGSRIIRKYQDHRRVLNEKSVQESNIFLNSFTSVAKNSGGKLSDMFEVEGGPKMNPYVDFLPASRNFYTYNGSLTTYPCSEGLSWVVFEEPVIVSSEDIAFLRHAVAMEENTITFPDVSRTLNDPKSYAEPLSIAAIVIGAFDCLIIAIVLFLVRNSSAPSAKISSVEMA